MANDRKLVTFMNERVQGKTAFNRSELTANDASIQNIRMSKNGIFLM